MRFLLDTNLVIALLKGRQQVGERVRSHSPGDIAVSSIIVHELYFGVFKGDGRPSNVHALDRLRFAVLDFDRDDARRAGEVRATLAARGTPIGPYDVLIAGQALAKGLTLVTRNAREFARVDGLVTENWED